MAARRRARPRDGWLAARELGNEPELEWTFTVFLDRAIALEMFGEERLSGLDYLYEPLERWDEVIRTLRMTQWLLDGGVPPEMTFGLTAGLTLYESAFYTVDGRLPIPSPGERHKGRHSVAVVGTTEHDELVFPNSWGREWGDDGFGYISRAYFEQYVDFVRASRPTWAGLSPAHGQKMHQLAFQGGRSQPERQDFVEAWGTTPNRIRAKTLHIAGLPHELRMRETVSARDGHPELEIVELRRTLGTPTVIGRMHVLHSRVGPMSAVEELFVRPQERRKGYGSVLEGAAHGLAARRGKSRLKLTLHESDALDAQASASRAFAASRGYRWHDRRSRRPNVVGFGTRVVAAGRGGG